MSASSFYIPKQDKILQGWHHSLTLGELVIIIPALVGLVYFSYAGLYTDACYETSGWVSHGPFPLHHILSFNPKGFTNLLAL